MLRKALMASSRHTQLASTARNVICSLKLEISRVDSFQLKASLTAIAEWTRASAAFCISFSSRPGLCLIQPLRHFEAILPRHSCLLHFLIGAPVSSSGVVKHKWSASCRGHASMASTPVLRNATQSTRCRRCPIIGHGDTARARPRSLAKEANRGQDLRWHCLLEQQPYSLRITSVRHACFCAKRISTVSDTSLVQTLENIRRGRDV